MSIASSNSPGRAILFANARSGRARRWLWPIIRQCELQGIDLDSVHVDLRPKRIRRALDTAGERGVTAVLVAGGDGTVGTIAGHLVHTKFVLGILPAGTSNDFARSLGIPHSAAGAVRVVVEGHGTRVDVGRAAGRVFVHAAILGINSDFARRAQRLRQTIGRASYPVAAIEVYRHRAPFRVEMDIEGKSERFDALEVAFVDSPVYGGALELEVPGLTLNDGRLGVIVVEDLQLPALLRAMPGAIIHRSLALEGSETFSIQRAIVSTSPVRPITIDGEIECMTPVDIDVLPQALGVFVPPSFAVHNHAGTD